MARIVGLGYPDFLSRRLANPGRYFVRFIPWQAQNSPTKNPGSDPVNDDIKIEDVNFCKLCGHPVIEQRNLAGASFYLPVSDELWRELVKKSVQDKKIEG